MNQSHPSTQPTTTPAPHVSVTMPVYNCAPYIRQTLESVLAQTYQDWECIVVDDASSDDTAAIAEEFAARDPRFTVHRVTPETKQPYPAIRNQCVELARGKWIAPLDGDDWWEPWKLERQVALAEAGKDIVVCFACGHVWRDGKVVGETVYIPTEAIARTLPLYSITVHPATLIDRQAMLEVGMYDLIMKTAQDWDLWLRLLWRFGAQRMISMQDPCIYYRRHGTNVTASGVRCNPFEWIIIRRTLRRYGWGLKNPVMTWRVLDHWLLHDMEVFSKAGDYQTAARRAFWAILLKPLGKWRWQQFWKFLKLRKTQQPGQPTAS